VSAQSFQLLGELDPTPATTVKSFESALLASENKIYFVGEDHLHGRELWETNGTAFGTHLVLDLLS
jgi:ELWxxDGT repeat protein